MCPSTVWSLKPSGDSDECPAPPRRLRLAGALSASVLRLRRRQGGLQGTHLRAASREPRARGSHRRFPPGGFGVFNGKDAENGDALHTVSDAEHFPSTSFRLLAGFDKDLKTPGNFDAVRWFGSFPWLTAT